MQISTIGYWGAYPEAESATSSYLVSKDGFHCLIDCGSGALSRLQRRLNPTQLDAIVLSHYHHDHVADIGPMQYAMLVQNAIHQTNKILPIYGHQEEAEKFANLSHQSTIGIAYDPAHTLILGPLTFQFLKTKHPVPCYAMRISDGEKTIVYTADTSYFEELITFCKGADLLIAECSFYEGMDGSGPGHMTSEECGKLARDAGVGELWLTHLPHFGDTMKLKVEAEQLFNGPIKLAEEDLSYGS
ncbi:ribonuclease BN (tRNA processing enzyme) [Salirhabdus euzebyi]|uniref:Ribonuclease BN (tRNA processing enzyme) n=1 Tax=Salirhabdus euzebyi TaxID=394506 RepID=A0A841Q7Y2_9BACI|nr:MBL fold metallo-hydrolase [Salirhabdus euzebyi]MBB6454699.1 ribonuclease BN (tRNA processing enzyme) [Salirhabdus euzebyi]